MNREDREKGFELKRSFATKDSKTPQTKAIPGYTGHLRNAKDIFGLPAGQVLSQDATGGVGITMGKAGKSAGSTFISALGADGAIWDHKYETTNAAMNTTVEGGRKATDGGPFAATANQRNIVGYTGHVHRAQDVIGASHSESVRHSENACIEETRARAKQVDVAEESKPHWTAFATQRNKQATWKQEYTGTLTTRPNPRKSELSEETRASNAAQADVALKKSYENSLTIAGESDSLTRKLPTKGKSEESEFVQTGPKPLFLKDNTLMTEAPEDEKGYTGHFGSAAKSVRIVGYTGHLHGSMDAIGLNYGRVERRTNPHEKVPEEAHPLGSRYQNAPPAGPPANAAVRALVQKQPQVRTSGSPIIDKVRARILQRGGRNGFRSLVRILRIMDDDGNKKLNRYELQSGLNTYGIFPNPLELDELVMHFDKDNSGQITVTEFMVAIRSDMNEGRQSLVRQAYALLDNTNDGIVTMEDISNVYDASQHPEVLAGEKTVKEVLQDFTKAWDKNGDATITVDEFMDYYRDLSAGIDSDQYFELMIRNAWHISGGEGAAANSSCRRVVVVHNDGHQTVEEIKNDLGIGPRDEAKMLANLRAQGITDVKKIMLYG